MKTKLLDAQIISEHYFTAKEGQQGAVQCFTGIVPAALGRLTFCVLILRNGDMVTGESVYASVNGFNSESERTAARKNAVSKAML